MAGYSHSEENHFVLNDLALDVALGVHLMRKPQRVIRAVCMSQSLLSAVVQICVEPLSYSGQHRN